MNKFYKLAIVSFLGFQLAGCTSEKEESIKQPVQPDEEFTELNETTTEDLSDEEKVNEEENTIDIDEKESTGTEPSLKETDFLETYSTEEIEYARIWLQFSPNPEIEEIYVEKFQPVLLLML